MDNAGYTSLTRQSGLIREMQAVANNIANMSTTGFRREQVVFTEYVQALGGGHASISMGAPRAGFAPEVQGALTGTGRPLDLAIEGEGFFRIATPDGDMLTRAGAFVRSPDGEVLTPDGMPLLDGGGAPVFVPPDAADIAVASDGTLSADGAALAQIGLWQPVDTIQIERRAGARFTLAAEPVPAFEGAGRIVQGFLEASNVSPVAEIARMIEVQRAYELGQGFLDKEDERMRGFIRSFGK